MAMLKRFLCLALCVLFLPLAVANAEATFSMAGYDGEDSNHDWETNQFFVRMQERTGISFTFQEYKSSAEWQKAKDQMFAAGELPDVLFKASLTSEELIRYTESGQLIDLKPLLEENAPHLWALLTENPEWMEAITLPNGKIGALPAGCTLDQPDLAEKSGIGHAHRHGIPEAGSDCLPGQGPQPEQ